MTRLQQVIVILTAVLIAIRVFWPVQYAALNNFRFETLDWPRPVESLAYYLGLLNYVPNPLPAPNLLHIDYGATMLQVIGILALAALFFVVRPPRMR